MRVGDARIWTLAAARMLQVAGEERIANCGVSAEKGDHCRRREDIAEFDLLAPQLQAQCVIATGASQLMTLFHAL